MKLVISSHRQTWSILCAVIFFLPFVLTSCGSGPSSFILSTKKQIEYISWKSSNNDSGISGNVISITHATGSADAPNQVGFTGTLNGQHLTINIMIITITGDIQSDNTLKMGAIPSNGSDTQSTWYAASEDDFNQLTSAYKAYSKVQDAIDRSSQDVQYPPTDSSSSNADSSVNSVQSALTNDQSHLSNISNDFLPCFTLGASSNFEIQDSAFQVGDNNKPTFATFNDDITAIKQSLAAAQKVPVPNIPNLTNPWVVSSAQAQKAIDAVNQKEQTINKTVADDQSKMDSLKQQYQSLLPQRTQYLKQFNCSGS